MVALTHGSEVRRPCASEAFAAVGTLATITEFDTPQSGLMTIRAQGTQRFRITSRDRLKHGLWVADVERLPADIAVPVPELDPEQTPAWRKAVEKAAADRANGNLPALPMPKVDSPPPESDEPAKDPPPP